MEIAVGGMTCGHCVRAVREAVSSVPGVDGVTVELETGVVRVDGTPDAAAIRKAIEAEGYSIG